MAKISRFGALLTAMSLVGSPATADDGDGEYTFEWSMTSELVGKALPSPEDDDNATGFFDLYEYRPNKSNASIQFGVSQFDLDVFAEDVTPKLQLRLRSPTSNLGISGDDVDEPFLNQRLDLFARPRGFLLDLDYRRLRTDEIRLFPNPTGVPGSCPALSSPSCGIASRFNDDTGSSDRFYSERTLFDADLRFRPNEYFNSSPDPWGGLVSELGLRGGYEDWQGKRQQRYILGGSDRTGGGANDAIRWRALTQDLDQNVADFGGGMVLVPGGLFTLALDVDREQFRNNASTILQSDVNRYAPTDIRVDGNTGLRTLGFIPDTNRTTGKARFNARIGDRVVIRGGFQGADLEQTGSRTPLQKAAGLRDNHVRFYSADLAGDITFTDSLSADAYFKFDQRKNEIDRGSGLFGPSNDTQVDPFLARVQWIKAGSELTYRPQRRNLVAAGWRGLWIDRRLDFVTGEERIKPDQASVRRDTRRYTGYLRTLLRPARGFRLSGEAGYSSSPETGYTREFGNGVYGNARLTYTIPTSRAIVLSAFARGESFTNDVFSLVGASTNIDKNFRRDNFSYGLTATGSPCNRVTLFASFFQHRDNQGFRLIRATERRFEAPDDVDFYTDTSTEYDSILTNATIGGTFAPAERTDFTVAYSFTRSDTRFDGDSPTTATIRETSRIRNDIHSVDTRLSHWIRDGFRVYLGYRFDRFLDDAELSNGLGSSVAPFDLTTYQHTVTLGVTLTSELLRRK